MVPKVLEFFSDCSYTFIGPLQNPDNRVIVWELKRRPLHLLPIIPSPNTGHEWILNTLKENLSSDNFNEIYGVLKDLPLPNLKLLYHKISSELVNRNGYVV